MSKVHPKFSATYRKGQTVLDHKEPYQKYCSANFKEGDRLTIVVKKLRRIRSSGQAGEKGNQNGYYWGVVLAIISQETGHTVDELHEIYKAMFAPKKRYTMPSGNEVVIAKSTAEMDTLEFTEYVERIRADAGEMNITIPDPEKVEA